MTPDDRFDLRGRLPDAPSVVEASAGTGKTYVIAGLVARYVAAGTLLDDMLVITFTRAATAELRQRVRHRLIDTRGALRTIDDGPQPRLSAHDDPVVEGILSDGISPSVAVRLLSRAISDVDGATITTIHQFCSTALEGMGLAAGLDRGAALVDLEHELRNEVAHDLLVRHASSRGTSDVGLWHAEALVAAATRHPDAAVVPSPQDGEAAKLRQLRWIAERARTEMADRKARSRWMGFDDLLTSLRDALTDSRHGAALADALRRRYQVVLVDEFQDTDPVQWAILDLAFRSSPLVLVGDPKQAIYGFRGADVRAYVAARDAVGPEATSSLGVSWRSDERLLRALNVLLHGATLGEDIAYREVAAARGPDPRIRGAEPDVALAMRVLRRDAHGLGAHGGTASQRRALVAADVAAQISRLLAQDVTIREEEGWRPLEPRDVAVLVRTNAEAAAIQERLHAATVPAVINGAGSVFATTAATDWLALLRALERPHDDGRARAAALTPLVDWDADRLLAARDPDWQALHDALHDWTRHLRDTSPASLWRLLMADQRVAVRLLRHTGGERRLTDLDHVADLAHQAWSAGVTTPHDLASWLESAIAAVDDGVAPDEQARRLESDADAVQVLTVHRSKGLEFPVVCCASLWRSIGNQAAFPVVSDDDGGRVLDVGSEQLGDRKKVAQREDGEEALRLMYVALTRAKHQAIVWWAPDGRTGTASGYAPLSKALFCRRSDGRANTRCVKGSPPKDDEATLARIREALEPAGDAVSVEAIHRVARPATYRPRGERAPDLRLARLGRSVDSRWRRTSYSALTAAAHASAVERDVTTDEDLDVGRGVEAAASGMEGAALRGVSLPLGGLPGGTRFGTYVHALLERTDFAAPDLDAELRRAAADLRGRSPVGADDHEVLLAGLGRAISTPLPHGRALRDLVRADRRDEMVFEMPLGGGPDPTGHVGVRDLRRLLARWSDEDHVLAAYAPRLGDAGFADGVRGFLTGSIDLVARVDGRYTVVDYKTNQLAPWGSEPSLWDYRPEAVLDAMCRGHYPLQALLYMVALHRFLRWRLGGGYDAERVFGGSAYLFVRGMVGPDAPLVDGVSPGVQTWRPALDLVDGVSDLLHRGVPS